MEDKVAEYSGAAQYRLASNYRDPKFLLGRVVDKLLCCVILIILYNGLGRNTSPDNLINVSSLLYMYTVLPGFAAISYMPGLVLERPLYVRCADLLHLECLHAPYDLHAKAELCKAASGVNLHSAAGNCSHLLHARLCPGAASLCQVLSCCADELLLCNPSMLCPGHGSVNESYCSRHLLQARPCPGLSPLSLTLGMR